MLGFEKDSLSPAIIKVVGVGGAGMNAVERMVSMDLQGVDLIGMNTDQQVLNASKIPIKLALGQKLTRGMGAGAKPEIGEQAAQEDRDQIREILQGADMVFITAGMGKGTGTGASPVVAEVAKELGALVVGVITMPFSSEGNKKMEIARKGREKLRKHVDTLITIHNDAILKVVDKRTPLNIAFKVIDDVLAKSVMGISDIIHSKGFINVDFADVKTVMEAAGDAIIGVGEGEGEGKIAEALEGALHHPLLEEKGIEGAKAVLVNVVGGKDLSVSEYQEIQQEIHKRTGQDAHIIIGFREDPAMEDKVMLTVIAMGFQRKKTPSEVLQLKKEEVEEKKEEISSSQEKKILHFKDEVNFGGNFLFPSMPLAEGLKDNLEVPAFLRRNRQGR